MRIAVDALGGDHAPGAIVAGAVAAARRLGGDEIFLVGERRLLEPELASDPPSNLSVRDAGGAVGMHEEPTVALRWQPDASVAAPAAMVREGDSESHFSAGNTR